MLLSEGRMDRRTDVTKLIAAHRNFVNAPKNVKLYKKNVNTNLQQGKKWRKFQGMG